MKPCLTSSDHLPTLRGCLVLVVTREAVRHQSKLVKLARTEDGTGRVPNRILPRSQSLRAPLPLSRFSHRHQGTRHPSCAACPRSPSPPSPSRPPSPSPSPSPVRLSRAGLHFRHHSHHSLADPAPLTGADNLESFPSILPPGAPTSSASSPRSSASSSLSGTPFDPSRFPSAPGPAIPASSVSLSYPLSSSSSSNSTTPATPSRTTLVSASHPPLPSLDPSASEYVVTSTVDGSVATVTVTNTAAAGNQGGAGGGSSGATSGRGWTGGPLVLGAVVGLAALAAA